MKVGRWILLAVVVGGAGYYGWTRYERARSRHARFSGRGAGQRKSAAGNPHQSRSSECNKDKRSRAARDVVPARSRIRRRRDRHGAGTKRGIARDRSLEAPGVGAAHCECDRSNRHQSPRQLTLRGRHRACRRELAPACRSRSTRSCPHAAAMSMPRLFRIATSTPLARTARANTAIPCGDVGVKSPAPPGCSGMRFTNALQRRASSAS